MEYVFSPDTGHLDAHRVITPHWAVSSDGALLYRPTGFPCFTSVLVLKFYDNHLNWSVSADVTATGEVLRFVHVDESAKRAAGHPYRGYEYHVLSGVTLLMDYAAEKPTAAAEPGAEPASIIDLFTRLCSDCTAAAIGFVPSDEYLRETYGDYYGGVSDLIESQTNRAFEQVDFDERIRRDHLVFALGFEPTEQYVREAYGDHWRNARGYGR